jgi:urease accessory protein UreF
MTPTSHEGARREKDASAELNAAEFLLGEFSTLLQQLGAPTWTAVHPQTVAATPGKLDAPGLKIFLDTYWNEVLQPVELPAIAQACGFARRGETRELIALDQRLGSEARLEPFRIASQQIGNLQLRRLRPLRDERTVQRYLRAVEAGQCAGWHTLVYGVTLAIFSCPLRQGLLHYGRETLQGLALAAVGGPAYLQPACQEIVRAFLGRLPAAVAANVSDPAFAPATVLAR